MKTKPASLAAAVSLAPLLLAATPPRAQEPAAPRPRAEAIAPAYTASTLPLAVLARSATARAAPAAAPVELNRLNQALSERILRAAAFLPPGAADAALQEAFAASKISPAVGLNFLGLGTGFPGFQMTGEPSDANGAVGATQYVQWVNAMYAVFDKATGAKVLGPLPGNLLFSALPAASICRTTNSGDIIAQYDKPAKRWVLTQFAIKANNGPYAQCVAVSKTGDATGAYAVYQYNFPDLPDYPKLGVWPDAYYITWNMFSHASLDFLYPKSCAFDRAKMLAGRPAGGVCFNLTAQDGSLLPGDLDGAAPPPAGAPNPQFELWDNSNLARWSFHVDFATPANSSISKRLIPVQAFTFACNNLQGSPFDTCVTQKSTAKMLDTLGDRVMYRAAYRRFPRYEAVVLSHSVDAGAGRTGVRWYEIRDPNAAPTVRQQSTYAPADGNHRWMPSAAMDKQGNILVGYSRSGPDTYPSVYLAGRLADAPLNRLQPEVKVIDGSGAQAGYYSRWGDYSAMSVDPVDNCTFWYTQQYIDAPNGDFIWKTRVASARFPDCR